MSRLPELVCSGRRFFLENEWEAASTTHSAALPVQEIPLKALLIGVFTNATNDFFLWSLVSLTPIIHDVFVELRVTASEVGIRRFSSKGNQLLIKAWINQRRFSLSDPFSLGER